MPLFWAPLPLALCGALISAPAACAAESPVLSSLSGPFMAENRPNTINDADFNSREAAEAYLRKALPAATAANPKYRGADGALTQWLTKTISFAAGKNPNGVAVEMNEDILEFRNGAQSKTGTHNVEFRIEDVEIAELTDSKDLTENGDKALGIIFRCISGKCMAAKWSGAPSQADWSDISIQDAAARHKILAAFQALKRFAGTASKS